MNLPHILPPSKKPIALGPKSLRAITQPVVVSKGGRATGDSYLMGLDGTLPLPDPSSSWRTLVTQRKYLIDFPYQRAVQIALDLSPEVAKGMFDFLRFANPGHRLFSESGNNAVERSTEEFINKLNCYYGSFKSHLDSAWSGIFITGGFYAELVLEIGGQAPADLVFNDPSSARFMRESHPVRGKRWRLFEESTSGPKFLDNNILVKYIGFDRLSDNPYGRPIIGPSVYSSIFLLGLMQDLQRAVANIGLSRMDYELDAEELLNLIDRNPDIAGDDAATAQFITDQIDKVKSVLDNLDVDDNYVHLSTVKVNYASNPMQMNMTGYNTIIEGLRRNVVNGFKGISALANILDSTTETHIRSQIEYYVSAIQSMQDEVSDVLTQFLNVGNIVQGIPSDMVMQFLQQRTSDRKSQAELESVKTKNVVEKFRAGLIDRDEARDEIQEFKNVLEVM